MNQRGEPRRLFPAMTDELISRRSLLRRSALLGASVPAVAALLSACAREDDDEPAAAQPDDEEDEEPVDEDDEEEEIVEDEDEEPLDEDEEEEETVEDEDEEPLDDDDMVEPAEGELVVAMAERSLTMDPADHYAISSTSVLRHIFDTLVDVTSESEFVAGLAESWEVIDDTTWQFDLRQGVEFHDGTPLDAEAVVATLERVRDNEELIKAFVFQNIETVEAENEYEVIVTTTTPFAALPGHLSMLGVMPAYAIDDETAFFDEPVGTGPFRFVSWVRGEEIELEANDNYWREGIPHVQHLTIRFIPELSTRVSGLRSGEIHIIDRVTPDMVETIEETDGVHVLEVPAVETSQWVFQMQREPVSDVRLRQAISLGIDREAIINEFMLGYAVPAVCPVPPPLIGHVDLGVKPYDPEAAREIIQDAGYEGVTLDFVLMRGVYPMQLEIVQAVQAMLGEVGIDINIRDMEIAAARDARSAGDFDLFYSGWAHMPHDPDWYFGQWFTADGSAGLNRYDNPEVEQLIMDARVPDPEQRQQAYEELQRILWEEEEPAIWPFYSVALYGVSDQVQNYEPRPDYYVLSSEVSLG